MYLYQDKYFLKDCLYLTNLSQLSEMQGLSEMHVKLLVFTLFRTLDIFILKTNAKPTGGVVMIT